MAEECRWYYYDNGYSCAIKREQEVLSSIDSDTVYRYCWGYHYEDCPRYKAKQSSGGCFLTSACVKTKGLPDDCYELTTLRRFRDEYMANQECGKCEIAHYYNVAPKIVEIINGCDNSNDIFEKIYNELVLPCIKMIEDANLVGAHNHIRTLRFAISALSG